MLSRNERSLRRWDGRQRLFCVLLVRAPFEARRRASRRRLISRPSPAFQVFLLSPPATSYFRFKTTLVGPSNVLRGRFLWARIYGARLLRRLNAQTLQVYRPDGFVYLFKRSCTVAVFGSETSALLKSAGRSPPQFNEILIRHARVTRSCHGKRKRLDGRGEQLDQEKYKFIAPIE